MTTTMMTMMTQGKYNFFNVNSYFFFIDCISDNGSTIFILYTRRKDGYWHMQAIKRTYKCEKDVKYLQKIYSLSSL